MKASNYLACTLVAVAALAPALQATVIFNDTFDSGTGTYYVDDTSGVTFDTSPPITNASGAITWNGNSNVIVGRSFADQTLSVGQTIRVTADFTTPDTAGFIRFGLWNFGANTITADNWGNTLTGSAEGYYMFFQDNGATSDERYQSVTLPTEIMGAETEDIGDPAGSHNFASGTTYSLLYEITLTAAGQVDTFASVSDGTTVLVSSTGQTTTNIIGTFDTFAFRNQSGSFSLDNVKLEIIPEPSSALLVGTLGGLCLLRRHRRR